MNFIYDPYSHQIVLANTGLLSDGGKIGKGYKKHMM